MRSLHIAWSLIKIPHLALSLFVFPLIIGLTIVLVQSLVTAMFVTVANRDTHVADQANIASKDQSLTRFILFGETTKRPPAKICRWVTKDGREMPPSVECNPDRLDIAIHTEDPETFNPDEYTKLFSGNVDRIHLCRYCSPDVVIEHPESDTITRSYSIYGTLLALSPFWNEEREQLYRKVSSLHSNTSKTLGTHYLKLPEVPNGIKIVDMRASVPVALNIALMIIVALWLALKAHRKVLDYFARNDVLLPLVAACGKEKFYSAIWILTGFRVLCFLVSGITLVILAFQEILVKGAIPLVQNGIANTIIWITTLVSSLAFVALLSSVAELKHRQGFLIILLKYVPLTLACLGALIWAASLLSTSDVAANARLVISAIPIFGTVPLLVAPTLNIPNPILIFHCAIALTMCCVIARSNTRWFAAHLDEI